jgi:hypothetical protein
MDLKRAWSLFAASRSLRFLIPMSVLLLVSIGWNVWHYRLDQERRVQAKEAERASKAAAMLVREQAELAESRRRARDAKSDARVQELYDEINQLTRLSERVLLPDRVTRATPSGASSSQDHAVRIR